MVFHPGIFWFGFSQGFIVGPMTLFGIREGLDPNRGTRYQLQIIGGMLIVDIFYMLISSFGMAKLVQNDVVQGFMWIAAAYMLIHMGLNSFHQRTHRLSFKHMHRKKQHFFEQDFFKAIMMNLVNPMAIVFWVVVVGSLYADYHHLIGPIWFGLNVIFSSFLASLTIAGLTYVMKTHFKPWMLTKVTQVGSLILIGYGLKFTWKAAVQLPDLVTGLVNLF